MEALLNVIVSLGLVASVVLIAWGMGLCARHGFDVSTVGPELGV